MGNTRILLIAAGLVVAIIALLTLDLSAAQFGIVMLGGAAVVAVVMFFLTRRRYQPMTEAEKERRTPPQL